MFDMAQLQGKNREELLDLIEQQDSKLSIQSDTIHYLQEQIALLKQQRFGRKSEQSEPNDAQMELELFIDGEQPKVQGETAAADERITIAAHQRNVTNKKNKGRKPLPWERQFHDIDESEKRCSCGCELTQIGEEVTEQLDIIPAGEYVIQHVYPKYACRGCEETVRQAKARKQPLPKSIATPDATRSLLRLNK